MPLDTMGVKLMIFLENLIFLAWKHQSVAYFIEKLVILWRCIKRYCITVEKLDILYDISWKPDISMKHTEQDYITVEKLDILLKTWYFQWFQ